jgi:hypothetical protein
MACVVMARHVQFHTACIFKGVQNLYLQNMKVNIVAPICIWEASDFTCKMCNTSSDRACSLKIISFLDFPGSLSLRRTNYIVKRLSEQVNYNQ